MQSKKTSVIEVCVNVFSGTIISYLLTLFALPLWKLNINPTIAVEITILYTLIALIRSYIIRRLFNRRKNKMTYKRKEIIGDCTLYLGDCLEVMANFNDNIIDLTVTSPPYDNLRTYANSLEWGEHVWKPIIQELYRITNDGGVVVWVVGDATIEGSETGTSFKQALYAMDCGFRLHDTMIFDKDSFQKPNHNRYWSCFEYMFVFSKSAPKSHNLIKDRENSQAGKKVSSKTVRNNDGTTSKRKPVVIAEFGKRKNIWHYSTGYGKGTTDKVAYKHPATFPEKLANDHIITWSNEGDTVFDPFMGSGTTGKMAIVNGRKFKGIEKVQDYFNIACERIEKAYQQTDLFVEAPKKMQQKDLF